MNTQIEIVQDNLEHIIDEEQDLLVEFFSPTCGPCKMLGFILDDLTNDLPDDYKIIQVNFHENPTLLEEYNIKSYPTVLIFKDGKEAKRFSGVRKKEVILKHIKEA